MSQTNGTEESTFNNRKIERRMRISLYCYVSSVTHRFNYLIYGFFYLSLFPFFFALQIIYNLSSDLIFLDSNKCLLATSMSETWNDNERRKKKQIHGLNNYFSTNNSMVILRRKNCFFA